MCLDLNEDAEKKIVNKDIVCYKRIISKSHVSEITFIPYDKKSFTGIIDRIQCEGKIHIQNGQAFFCTNNAALKGRNCIDKLGYRYSWIFDDNICSIVIDGVDVMNTSENPIFKTPYQRVEVKLGETYTSELIRRRDDTIEIGLHTFAKYEDARNDGNGVVAKCIIPKGAEYYEGKFYGDKSYASNQLKYVELITK